VHFIFRTIVSFWRKVFTDENHRLMGAFIESSLLEELHFAGSDKMRLYLVAAMWIGCSSQENNRQEGNQYLLVEGEQPVRLLQGTPGGAGLPSMKHVGWFLIKCDVGRNEQSKPCSVMCEKRPGRAVKCHL
jgi:hypothetical protein